METIVIVGVGLIGGSFALALRHAGFSGKIIGVSSPRTTDEALRLGVIDQTLSLEQAVPRATLVYLAHPISRILEILPSLDPLLRPGTLLTDAGSTKSVIVRRAAQTIHQAQFLGGHPMAGKETRGVAAAEPGLFHGRNYFLTPLDPSHLETPAARFFLNCIRNIGAIPRIVSPEKHDRLVAFVSHLPQLISTALAACLAEHPEVEDFPIAAGPGLLDSTRLAMSPYEIWSDILSTNVDQIATALTSFVDKLNAFRASLSSTSVETQFQLAARFSKSLRQDSP